MVQRGDRQDPSFFAREITCRCPHKARSRDLYKKEDDYLKRRWPSLVSKASKSIVTSPTATIRPRDLGYELDP
jgi:hypothetical protein